MHRESTRFAARITRVATALERRAIVATYEVHDRALANRASRKRYADAPPALDETQQRVLGELDRDGFAVLPFAELAGADAWKAVEGRGAAFVAETHAALERERAGEDGGLKRRHGKEFVARAYSFEGAVLTLDEPWLRACLSPALLDLANAYLRMWSKLTYVDLWYTAPQLPDEERVASQLWHRDFDDQHLLKAFLYLVDVDPSMGPFEYVAGSHVGGRNGGVHPWGPMRTGRVPDEDVTGAVPAEDVHLFAAPKGTLILCNTSGLHRGGFSISDPRVLATATYCSPASLKALSLRNYTLVDPDGLDDAARFAAS